MIIECVHNEIIESQNVNMLLFSDSFKTRPSIRIYIYSYSYSYSVFAYVNSWNILLPKSPHLDAYSWWNIIKSLFHFLT